MKLPISFLFLLYSVSLFAQDPYRMIAILENERLLRAESGESLAQYLKNEDASIRSRAALAAARIGNPAMIPHLAPLVNDGSAEVRRFAAFAFGQIKHKDGLAPVGTLLKDKDPEARRLAIEAAGRIGGLETTSMVLPILDDQNLRIREQAALSLALIKDVASLGALSKKILQNDPAQWSYIYAVYRIANPQAEQTLHNALKNPVASPSTGDPSSLLFALKGLWQLKKPLTQEEAERMLSHNDSRVRVNALDVIAASADKEKCGLIATRFKEMDFAAKAKAADAMAAAGCSADLLPAFEANSTVNASLILAHAKLRKIESLDVLTKYSADKSWLLRARAAQALAEIEKEKAIPLLKTLAKDTDSAVRTAALESLGAFLPDTEDVFLPLLKEKDFVLRSIAADTLAKTQDLKYLPLLIDAYRFSNNPAEAEGRLAILDSLSQFRSSETIPIFLEALNDPEYIIRFQTIESLKKLNGETVFTAGKTRPLSDFLFSSAAVSSATIAKYPADFGKVTPDQTIKMQLSKGTVMIRLLNSEAPVHASNIVNLASKGFYNGHRIHRVVPNFVIQGGDPRGDGWGGSGENVKDQMNLRVYQRGMVGLPIAGKDTGSSQFFITHSRQPHLDGNYTIYGEVLSGMDVVDRTEIGDTIIKVEVIPPSQSDR